MQSYVYVPIELEGHLRPPNCPTTEVCRLMQQNTDCIIVHDRQPFLSTPKNKQEETSECPTMDACLRARNSLICMCLVLKHKKNIFEACFMFSSSLDSTSLTDNFKGLTRNFNPLVLFYKHVWVCQTSVQLIEFNSLFNYHVHRFVI